MTLEILIVEKIGQYLKIKSDFLYFIFEVKGDQMDIY